MKINKLVYDFKCMFKCSGKFDEELKTEIITYKGYLQKMKCNNLAFPKLLPILKSKYTSVYGGHNLF